MSLTIADIEAAREPVAALARLTPLIPSRRLSELSGAPVLLKAEVLQRTGSFKVRGAANFLAHLPPVARGRGVVAASAGNHAQGVAVAARAAGVPCRVVMPEDTALPKEQATRDYGAEVVLHGTDVAMAVEEAQRLAALHGWTFVPPFDDERVIAGQGTLGLELLAQDPDLEAVVVPVGGGGLAAGVGLALKARRPRIRVIGVQPEAMASAVASYGRAGPVAVPTRWTLADGCAVPRVGARTLPLLNAHLDTLIAVSEEWISAAMVFLLERAHLVAEGAGALGVAALLSGALHLDGRRTAVVLSGGNIDVQRIAQAVEHGLARAGRYLTLLVTLRDRPGELARVLQACSAEQVNVVDVEHRRSAPRLPVGAVEVQLLLETRDRDHARALVQRLRALGLRVTGEEPALVRIADPDLPPAADPGSFA